MTDTVPVPRELLASVLRYEPVNQQLLEALRQSLAALINVGGDVEPSHYFEQLAPVIDNARAAIAAAEHPSRAAKAAQPAFESVPRDEPVAWRYQDSDGDWRYIDMPFKGDWMPDRVFKGAPLYTRQFDPQEARNAALLEAAELCEAKHKEFSDADCENLAAGAGHCADMLRAKVKEQK